MRFSAKLIVEVALVESPLPPTRVEIILDSTFTLENLSSAGTALQAGVWEALKVGMKETLDQLTKSTGGGDKTMSRESSGD